MDSAKAYVRPRISLLRAVCKGFASCDRLHKTLWNAATTTAIWCDGFELLEDLAIRAELRKSDPDRVTGPHPIPLEGSVITRIFEQLRQR